MNDSAEPTANATPSPVIVSRPENATTIAAPPTAQTSDAASLPSGAPRPRSIEATATASTRAAESPKPANAARATTGRPPRPRTRRAAMARAVSCSSGRKNPGPETKSSAQKVASGA